MKHTLLGIALGILLCTASAQARTIVSLYDTGVLSNDANGNPATLVPSGSIDPHYTITAGGIGAPTAFVTLAGQAPFTGNNGQNWSADSSSSQWISPRPDESTGADSFGVYTYSTTFDLSGYDLSTIAIAGLLSSDNAVTAVRINGFDIGFTGGAFTSFTPFSLPLGHYLAAQNTLQFDVNNDVGAYSPSGLRVELTGLGEAPEPGTTTLIGLTGLFFGGIQRLRRRNRA